MRFNLKREFFSDREFLIAEEGAFRATAFKYSTGVCAIKVENEKGYFIILPFQGQQIWRANFLGRELSMQTKFDEPVPTLEYLETYGGFLLHCGINAFGVPQSDDNHRQHGEIPNGAFDTAYIDITDEYIAVGGTYNFNKSFVKNYSFTPETRLYHNETVLKIMIELENRRALDMEYMYLCHINFRPIDGSELIYSADYDLDHITIHKSVPDTLPEAESKKLSDYFDALEKEITLHHKVGADYQAYNPEICFTVKYNGDENNRAYTLQYNNDGASYVSHPVDVLPSSVRWISRTGDENSMGMVLPATAEHFGYTNAKRKGQIKILPGYSKLNFMLEAGWLEKADADKVKAKIEDMKK